MRLVDAPTPGWYPDPEGRSLLRWWAGTDWTEQRRPCPSARALAALEAAHSAELETTGKAPPRARNPSQAFTRAEADNVVGQVGEATHRELQRAAREISQGIQASIARLRPVIVGHVNRVLRWVRIGVVTAAVLVVIWFVIQFIAQATFLSWLGDRIDNITS